MDYDNRGPSRSDRIFRDGDGADNSNRGPDDPFDIFELPECLRLPEVEPEGPASLQLERRETPAGSYQIAVSHPDHLASNFDPEQDHTDHIFINGVTTAYKRIERAHQSVTQAYGRDFTAIIVPPKSNRFDGIMESIGGLLNNKIGNMLDHTPSNEMVSELIRRIQSGRDVHVVAFSKGAIITSNSLREIHRQIVEGELDMDWDHVLDSVKVTECGFRMHWPKGLTVSSFQHDQDMVPAMSELGRFIGGSIASVFEGYNTFSPDAVVLKHPQPYDSHDFAGYMNNLHNFVIWEQLDPARDLDTNLEMLAQSLHLSIALGTMSDEVHENAITAILNEPEFRRVRPQFADLFLAGLDADGSIGDFKLSEQNLRKLTEYS